MARHINSENALNWGGVRMTPQPESAKPAPVSDIDRRAQACFSIALGIGWVVAIGTLTDPIGFIVGAKNPDGWYLGRSAELLMFAAACIPLAFTHTIRASVLQIAATHGGVFALLATVCVLLSPSSPFPILPWMEMNELAEPLFYAPLAVWAAGTAFLLALIHLEKRLVPQPAAAMTVEFWTLMICAAMAWVQWWVTMRVLVGGWYLGSYYEGFGTKLARVAVGAAYTGIALVCARVFSRVSA